MFEHISHVFDWRRVGDLFRQLSTALGTVCGDKDAATIRLERVKKPNMLILLVFYYGS